MKIKTICAISAVFALSACAGVQQGLEATMSNISNDFKAAVTPRAKSTGGIVRSGSREPGSLSVEECKSSRGKTKAYMEKLVGIKLNEMNASAYTSLSESYNLKITGVKTRLGSDFGVCIIIVNHDTQRVDEFSTVIR